MSAPLPLAMIVAMADNRAIGADNTLPWHLPEDLKHFKRVTLGKPVLMGRKTYESIGRPLPGRVNIVVSRQPDFVPAGVEVCTTVEAALERAQLAAREAGASEVMVIGGGQLYRELLPRVQRIYLTEVHCEVAGDAFFPELDANWREVERQRGEAGDGPAYSFVVLERG